jgi:hypothetical protein
MAIRKYYAQWEKIIGAIKKFGVANTIASLPLLSITAAIKH